VLAVAALMLANAFAFFANARHHEMMDEDHCALTIVVRGTSLNADWRLIDLRL
jgi:hypothetical protein